MTRANVIPIASPDDPRIAHYRNLKERDLAREGGRFIAEGELVVRRLLASDYQAESLLLAEKKVAAIAPLAGPQTVVYSAPHDLVNRIIGFKFHSGVMACGLRRPRLDLRELAAEWGQRPVMIVVLPQIANTDNMGSLIRISSAFGADAMLLGEQSCDPYYRQSIRVSMGTIFRMPMVQSENLLNDLRLLRHELGFSLAATVLDDDAQELRTAGRPRRMAILFGNEAQGLAPEHVAACDRRLTIPMDRGTDSLNVSVAAGIFLYHFTRYAKAE